MRRNGRKKIFNEPVRTSVVFENDYWEYVKRVAMRMSIEQDRLITPAEAVRLAVEKCYPMEKNHGREHLQELCKIDDLNN